MRRGRGVTPPSVERSFGLQYYPTCLASSSRVKTCRGRRGARQGASSSHQEWGRAREDATRGRPEGVTGGSPLSKTLLGRPAEVNACRRWRRDVGSSREPILPLIPSPFRRFEGVGRRRLTR